MVVVGVLVAVEELGGGGDVVSVVVEVSVDSVGCCVSCER